VVDLGGQIVPPQRDVEQKPHSGHDPVAIADAQPALRFQLLERLALDTRHDPANQPARQAQLHDRHQSMIAIQVERGNGFGHLACAAAVERCISHRIKIPHRAMHRAEAQSGTIHGDRG
jgi:hypothetical protein